jgi:hypothetical protein
VRRARAAAWGPKLIPVAGKRRVKVSLGDEHDEEGEVVGSKRLDMVVDEAGVYLVCFTLFPLSGEFTNFARLYRRRMASYTLSTRRRLPNLR